MGDSGDYQVRFVDTKTCYVSTDAVNFKLKYDDGDVIMYSIKNVVGSYL